MGASTRRVLRAAAVATGVAAAAAALAGLGAATGYGLVTVLLATVQRNRSGRGA